jgi:hypothetical protein
MHNQKIYVVTAADHNFKDLLLKCAESTQFWGYKTFIYDLGGLGVGKPFSGKVSDEPNAKIPCKPAIIKDALKNLTYGDTLAWLDADCIMWNKIDGIVGDYNIGVTVRRPKDVENELPINAGVVFVRKTAETLSFIDTWINKCNEGVSDQVELNKLCKVSTKDLGQTVNRNFSMPLKIKVFPCDVYNNFYFKKTQLHASIIHYKHKHRYRWPERTVRKIPKGFDGDRSPYVETK